MVVEHGSKTLCCHTHCINQRGLHRDRSLNGGSGYATENQQPGPGQLRVCLYVRTRFLHGHASKPPTVDEHGAKTLCCHTHCINQQGLHGDRSLGGGSWYSTKTQQPHQGQLRLCSYIQGKDIHMGTHPNHPGLTRTGQNALLSHPLHQSTGAPWGRVP